MLASPNLKISIIMPCFNCDKTLQEAVESCYQQGLQENEFEIRAVNDCSVDATPTLLKEFAIKYSNFHVHTHVANLGGGAARNSAIKEAKAEVIFCLDSDDVLPPNMLIKLYNFLSNSDLDGALLQESRIFDDDIKKYISAKNINLLKEILLDDIFLSNSGFLTQVNFMFRKSAFNLIGGYPTNHGFDTQNFGIRFLALGLRAKVCPDTYYYHRQTLFGKKSYYETEYERGLMSINTYFALESIIDYLSDDALKLICQFDIFTKNKHGPGNNLFDALSSFVQGGNTIVRGGSEFCENWLEDYKKVCTLTLNCEWQAAQTSFLSCIRSNGDMLPVFLILQLRINFGICRSSVTAVDQDVIAYLSQTGVIKPVRYKRIHPKLRSIFRGYKFFQSLLKVS